VILFYDLLNIPSAKSLVVKSGVVEVDGVSQCVEGLDVVDEYDF
jgi:hypothetical protein